jgi:hypothetical protein
MLSREEARKEAAYTLRFEIGGNIPFLGDAELTNDATAYKFPIFYSKRDLEAEEPTWFEKIRIGHITVDRKTGNITSSTSQELCSRIRQVKSLARIGILEPRD